MRTALLLVPAVALALTPLAVVHPVRVQGASMAPALQDGQLCWALRAWCAGRPCLGQVWRVQGPEGPAVKRIAALPGERVEIRRGQLLVEGRPRPEPFVAYPDHASMDPRDLGTGYLLLGDNRKGSRDGRVWGPLSPEALESRILGAGSPEAPGFPAPGRSSTATPGVM
jgi:signal peptidase I